MSSRAEVVAVFGPTASGKSAVAEATAARLETEVVSVDALQVYRGFDVGTAKPSPAERARIPHHLIDILDPVEIYSAGEFARRARAVIDSITARGSPAILVGGSGLYLRALWSGIAPLPASDPELRQELERRLVDEGVEALADELAEVDAETARRVGRRDAQRILRALEVREATGVALSAWLRKTPFAADALPMRKIGLTLPRAVLYDRIEARARAMLRDGWADEVRSLLASGVPATAPAFQAIGYTELLAAIEGRRDEGEAVQSLITRTRRFAKRQETWFRRESGIEWLDGRLVDASWNRIVGAVESAGGGG